MRFKIQHESGKRMRIHIKQNRMTYEQADLLLYYMESQDIISFVKVYDRTCDVAFVYEGDRQAAIELVQKLRYEDIEVPEGYVENSGRQMSHEYQEKVIGRVALHYGIKWLVPLPVRVCLTVFEALRYIRMGLKALWKRKIEVSLLDATAISVAVLRGDFSTASSVMFLLSVGELLEDWTHKKSIDDLARSMSLNVENVWLVGEEKDILVPVSDVRAGDYVRVHMGNVIPFDGIVAEGEGMVNQSSLTGESIAVRKTEDGAVFAGSVLEEGELTIFVRESEGETRFDKIVKMIEESEKLKSGLESKAEHLADSLVPYSLGGTLLTYLLTRNATKALSVLMVDFSCALKLAMPISVLSAIREANAHQITVKGGRFLENMAEADTIVFDKTGTLTKAKPTVVDVISFNGEDPNELLRIAACMEEHFPHSMANAVIEAAQRKGLVHDEMHSKVEYIVAHGISTTIGDKRAVIGSYHFVFEDEGCLIDAAQSEKIECLPDQYSYLYLAIDYKLAAVICIEDPLRGEAPAVLEQLRQTGVSKIVMMTGDGRKTASVIAEKVGVDEFYAEVLPEDKAAFIEKERAAGRKVVMIGDGINDSPALSAADVGIAIRDGAQITREIADITISADNLYQIVMLKSLCEKLMKRIQKNYRQIVSFNTLLILLGVGGVIQPSTSALLHNLSTIAVGLKSTERLLEE